MDKSSSVDCWPPFPILPRVLRRQTMSGGIVSISKSTQDILVSLDDLSGHTLARRDDLGELLELALTHGRKPALEELSFLAKFIFKTHGLLQRIGSGADDYASLTREFGEAIQKSVALLVLLLTEAPQETRQHFESSYMLLTSGSLANLL